MILNDLFESRMSDLDIEYQDYKNLEPVAFYSRYKMTKDEWASKNWSLIKGSETVHEGAIKNLHIDLADKYRELAPKIEKYRDSYLAGQLYDALEAIAIEHGAELEFKRMLNGARNRAHMDYDTNPGGFQNWFWYLPFADDEDIAEDLITDEARMSAAVKLQRAWEREQAKSTASRKRGEEVMAKARADAEKKTKEQDRKQQVDEKQDACYRKVKSRYKVWPSAYASGALVQCRKKGAANWGNKTKK